MQDYHTDCALYVQTSFLRRGNFQKTPRRASVEAVLVGTGNRLNGKMLSSNLPYQLSRTYRVIL